MRGRRSVLWRRAPFVLWNHRAALAAVVIAAFLVSLAASSGPFVTTATASAALKDQLVGLSSLATGLEISAPVYSFRPQNSALADAVRARERAARGLASRLHLKPPVFTEELGAQASTGGVTGVPRASESISLLNGNGDVQVTGIARTGFLAHVRVISQTAGDGVWVSDLTAQSAGLRLGGRLRLAYSTQGVGRTVSVRVKGIYRALDRSAPGPYWANLLEEILPPGVDPPPPARYVFMSPSLLHGVVRALSSINTYHYQGRTIRFTSGPELIARAEMAVNPSGLTLSGARSLVTRFRRLRSVLVVSALGRELGCTLPHRGPVSPAGQRLLCSLSSSLSAAVAIADRSASAITPVVTLLSAAGAAIALGVASVAGVFLVRRRQAEAALHFARGESVRSFASRTAIELAVPMLAGAATGFALALGVTGLFAPSGSVDRGTLWSAAAAAAAAAVVALLLACTAAALVFLHLFDSGVRVRRLPRWLVWELPVLAAGGFLLDEILGGGGLARSASGSAHPTLAVFVLPLLLVAGSAGLLTRTLRVWLRRRPGRAGDLPVPVFFVLRRLSGAGGVLVALIVVAAVAFGAFFYARSLDSSITRNVDEKGYIAYGGDVQGLVTEYTPTPRGLPFPVTTLDYANQGVTVGSASGDSAELIAIDPATLGHVIHWYPDWGQDPRPLFPFLRSTTGGSLPAIVTNAFPVTARAIWVGGVRLPLHVVARVDAFPGMSVGSPLIVVARSALAAASARAHAFDLLGSPQTYVWASGPTGQVTRALEAPPLQASFLTSIDAFRSNPDVQLARRAFTYLNLIAAVAGVLVFVGLLLYVQARQRSQAVASALVARMGLQRRSEVASLSLEFALIALLAAVIGGVAALIAAGPIVGHIDPLPDDPPVPSLVLPTATIAIAVAGLLFVSLVAGAVTSWFARRTDMSEALRIV